MKTTYLHLLTLCLILMGFSFSSCTDKPLEDNGDDTELPTEEDIDLEALNRSSTINFFAYNVMDVYYLWVDEIKTGMEKWLDKFAVQEKIVDPISTVEKIRYKDENGKDIDKWTYVTDSATESEDATQGYSKTYGFDFSLYKWAINSNKIVLVVNFVFKDSPADKAGLKRGDVFHTINGTEITTDNYQMLLQNSIYNNPNLTIATETGSEIKMTAVDMYEDPVHLGKVFDCDGKKVGYIHFTQFTLDAIPTLYELAKEFKEEGISELILDLRYNPGGYVLTTSFLASVLAPQSVALDKDAVFFQIVYNEFLSEHYEDTNEYFETNYSFNNHNNELVEIDSKDANLNLNKLYVIYTGSSASASELIVTGLQPYMDIELIGEQSHGKYCAGILYTGKDWFEDYKDAIGESLYNLGQKYIEDWGISVIMGRYANKFGETPCMPNGFIPENNIKDNPMESYSIGDEREVMLNYTLKLAGKTDLKPRKEDVQGKSISTQMIPIDPSTYKKELGFAIMPKPKAVVSK